VNQCQFVEYFAQYKWQYFTDWSFNDVPQAYLFDRGYTGHEHLDAFSLINMNGRVYDPWLGRFISPDPFLQAPTNSQNYNRYSYALNNPFKYTDPTGYRYGPHFNGLTGRPMKDDMPGYGENANDQMFGRHNDLSDGICEMQALFNNMVDPSNQRVNQMIADDKERKKNEEDEEDKEEGTKLFGNTPYIYFYGIGWVANPFYKDGSAGGGEEVNPSAGFYLVGASLYALGNAAELQFNTLGNIEKAAANLGMELNLLGQRAGAARFMFAVKGTGILLGGAGIVHSFHQIQTGQVSVGQGSFDIGFGVVGFMGTGGLFFSGGYIGTKVIINQYQNLTPQQDYPRRYMPGKL